MSSALLSFFDCQHIRDGVSVVRTVPQVSCLGSEYATVRPAVVAGLVLVVAGLPLLAQAVLAAMGRSDVRLGRLYAARLVG